VFWVKASIHQDSRSQRLSTLCVSVPLRGVLGESVDFSNVTAAAQPSFPSPCGVFWVKALAMNWFVFLILAFMFPSPCGVFWVKGVILISSCAPRYAFPSPCGVFWVKVFDKIDADELAASRWFPSPCGVFWVKVKDSQIPPSMEQVSVPLRGVLGERRAQCDGSLEDATSLCFRPLAGCFG
jgi:hypothetical protein